MSISIFIAPISDSEELVKTLLISEFEINPSEAKMLAKEEVKPHFDKLKDTCFILAETNYVDRVYRDSYYHYYSSKFSKYKRDCIRLSIFEGKINDDDFRKKDKIEELIERFRGFIVLRPTAPFIVGRSLISPKALISNNFLCCTTKIHTTVNSIKFSVEGFPHSSQDTETISCAETTLWAVMEYFGTKYPEYKPVLPSKIVQTLNTITIQRQIPSQGLNIEQMSFALKEFGFGTRIYSNDQYQEDFHRLFSCYVESGLPLILGIDNRPEGNIGHAMLCIGHEKVNGKQIDEIPANYKLSKGIEDALVLRKINLYDWDDIQKEFVFVDDNYPVYQKAKSSEPTKHYKDASWQSCIVKHFIVPLYPKIYLEAYEAKNYILRFLIKGPVPLAKNNDVLIRFFLTSSRSFKDKLALNITFNSDIRDIILETPMPKFIWVSELSTKNQMKMEPMEANGLIILDATEANISNKPLLFAAYDSRVITWDKGKLENKVLHLPPFSTYDGNVKNL